MSNPMMQALQACAVWDAGELGCGELVLDLRDRLRAAPGKILRVVALDPGAPEDIPSWCRMTGHTLVQQDLTTCSYWIEARGVAGAAPPKSPSDITFPDAAEIYGPLVFELAKSVPPDGALQAPDATASARAKLCGSTIEVDIQINDGRIGAYAHRLKACLFGRAGAAVVARHIVGTSLGELTQMSSTMRAMLEQRGPAPAGRWHELEALAPVHALKARHASALLVFTALDKAISNLPGSDGN